MVEFEDVFQIPIPCNKLKVSDPRKRAMYCSSCDREIMNLSALTRAEAMALVTQSQLHCAGYWVDEQGMSVFADEMLLDDESGKLTLMGQSLWRHAQVLSLPMLLAACEPAEPSSAALAVEANAISIQEPAPRLEVVPGAASPVKAPPLAQPPDTTVLFAPNSYNDEAVRTSRTTLKQSLDDVELIQEMRNERLRHKDRKTKRRPDRIAMGIEVGAYR